MHSDAALKSGFREVPEGKGTVGCAEEACPGRLLCNGMVCSAQNLLHMQEASETYLKDILGFEENQLVSTDFVNDARSSIVDKHCTQVRDLPL